MFSKILGKKEGDSSIDDVLEEKISKMNLTEMRSFVNNKDEISEGGIIEVLTKLITPNSETSKRYLELDDMDVKIKKGFDLVITIAKHKKITITAIELIQEFIIIYHDLIEKYDKENKQIYKSKLRDALEIAIKNIDEMTELKRKMGVLS